MPHEFRHHELDAVGYPLERQPDVPIRGLLLPEPLVRHDGPTTLQVTVNEQAAERRWVVHLLHYIPERRSQDIDVIEDVIPLYDVRVSVKIPHKVEAVMRVPEQEPLQYPAGIDYVFVNGEAVIEQGRQTGARPGKVTRRKV